MSEPLASVEAYLDEVRRTVDALQHHYPPDEERNHLAYAQINATLALVAAVRELGASTVEIDPATAPTSHPEGETCADLWTACEVCKAAFQAWCEQKSRPEMR